MIIVPKQGKCMQKRKMSFIFKSLIMGTTTVHNLRDATLSRSHNFSIKRNRNRL